MPTIHPTSVIHPDARLDPSVEVGPFCNVGPHVTIGAGTRLISHVAVMGRTTIGQGNTIFPMAVLGADPQDLKFHGEDSELVIGDRNEVRESVTIHKGTENGGNVTRIGDGNLVMAYVHIGHDCTVGDRCILANMVQLAGHIHVDDHANIGGATAIHHYVTIHKYAFIGGVSRIVHDVPPFMLVEGNPARVRGVNLVGLTRHKFTDDQKDTLKQAWRLLYRGNGDEGAVGSMAEAITTLRADHGDDPHIQQLLAALEKASQGVHGRALEATRRDNRYRNPVK